MRWVDVETFLKENWGNLASIIGLAVSIATLWVAKGAKAAADAARAEARKRSLAEELQDAQRKSEQIGLYIAEAKWDVVFIRAQELQGTCSLVQHRWPEAFWADSGAGILMAQVQAGSIANVAMRAGTAAPSELQVKAMTKAQQRVHEIVSGELGKSLRMVERS